MSVGRRLLLVSYHFPPDPAVGGRRWQQFARYLADHDWGIDVVTRDLGLLKFRDDQQVKVLPADVRVLSAPEPESNLARLERAAAKIVRRFIPRRATTTIPDSASATTKSTPGTERANGPNRSPIASAVAASVNIARERSWAIAASRVALDAARDRRYDAVISSGPPHFAHEGARRISRALRLPLLIDLRDPWSAIERVADDYASPIWFSVARHYERRCVRDAALVIMNTDLSRDDMQRRFPDAAGRIVTIRNGSDDELLPVVPPSERFSIRFAGSIYLDRDPRLVFRAAASVVRRLSLTPRMFALEFIGHVDDVGGQSVRAMAEQEGVTDFVHIEGPRPREQAMRFLAGGTMLLNLPQGADMCVPAKIFEYVRFNAWLLVLAAPDSATAAILRGTSADVIEPSDVDGIARVIEARYQQHARGERPMSVGHDGRFDRAIQAKVLLDHLNSIVPMGRGG